MNHNKLVVGLSLNFILFYFMFLKFELLFVYLLLLFTIVPIFPSLLSPSLPALTSHPQSSPPLPLSSFRGEF